MARTLPSTIDWIFSTGRDNPVWAVTYDIDLTSPAAVEGTFNDDSRAPYGELAIDGEGFTGLDGVAWGDRYKFTNIGGGPVTLNRAWTWNVANTVPYVKEWLNGPLTVDNKRDATMGIVQTQTLAQQDAGGGRHGGAGSMTTFWNTTSGAVGNACNNAGRVHPFPCANDWPYQANANSLDFEFPNGSNNATTDVENAIRIHRSDDLHDVQPTRRDGTGLAQEELLHLHRPRHSHQRPCRVAGRAGRDDPDGHVDAGDRNRGDQWSCGCDSCGHRDVLTPGV